MKPSTTIQEPSNEKIHVPKWLQNELHKKTEPQVDRIIAAYKKEGIGFSRFSLQTLALDMAAMGYFHAIPNPPEEKVVPEQPTPSEVNEGKHTVNFDAKFLVDGKVGNNRPIYLRKNNNGEFGDHIATVHVNYDGKNNALKEKEAQYYINLLSAAPETKNNYDQIRIDAEEYCNQLKADNENWKGVHKFMTEENERLKEANRELIEALRVAENYVIKFKQEAGIGEINSDLTLIQKAINKHTKQ